MFLFFDTETTGLPVEGGHTNPAQPRLVQIAAILTDPQFKVRGMLYSLVRPEGFEIPVEASNIHGITTEIALAQGMTLRAVLYYFLRMYSKSTRVIAHNLDYDKLVMRAEYHRLGADDLVPKAEYCTMKAATPILKLPKTNGKAGFKWPKVKECLKFFFNEEEPEGAHDALVDTQSLIRIYRAIVERGSELQRLDQRLP